MYNIFNVNLHSFFQAENFGPYTTLESLFRVRIYSFWVWVI